jgi:hypothetical protein
MSWKSILKKPYEIEQRFKMPDETMEAGYSNQRFVAPYNELFQGFQGNETTKYWTYSFDEAVDYSFFGSKIGQMPRFADTEYGFKDKDQPKVFSAKPTKKTYTLTHDVEYGDSGRGIEGGVPHEEDDDDINRNIDDKDKKQVDDDKIIESALKFINGERDTAMSLDDREIKEAKKHMYFMLNKYFGINKQWLQERLQ